MSPESSESSEPSRLTLIRHGESNVTVDRVIGGRITCSGLSELGRRQCEAFVARMDATGDLAPDVLLASDFPRAIETAEIVRRSLGPAVAEMPIEEWRDFGEHDPGPEIDGMTFRAYVDRFGMPDWTGDPDAVIFPGGETMREFHGRVGNGLAEVRRRFSGRHVAIACHGGVIDAVMRSLCGLGITGGPEFRAKNTSITEFIAPSSPEWGWRVARFNDAAHLAGLPEATNSPVEASTPSGEIAGSQAD
ncbi:MAG: histidine phosphatase family protein [Ilumatobacter sp.]